MLQSIIILVIFLQTLQVHSRVILENDSSAKLVIHPETLFLNAFTDTPLSLVCTGESKEGGTFSDFKWLNTRHEIIQEGVPGVRKLGNKSLELSFVDPTAEDSGIYKCTATYGNSEYLETEISILFREDIKFENCPNYQILYSGEENEIKCRPVSKQQLSITWTKDNKKLETGRFVFRDTGILLKNVQEEDAGIYDIVAFEPTTGTLKHRNISVDVFNRKEENYTGIIEHVSVLKVTADTVFFEIRVSGNAKNIEAKYREFLEDTDRNITWNLGATYVVRNLTSSGQYTFQFRTKPSQITKWSPAITVTLLPSAPEVILRQLNEELLEIEWVRSFKDNKRQTIDKFQLSYQPVQALKYGWKASDCNVTIDIPTSCFISVYKLANLSRKTTYEIRIKAHTSSGFGNDYRQKVRLS